MSSFHHREYFEIVELEEFSGDALKIYSICMNDDKETLFDKFLIENQTDYPGEIGDIINKLEVMGQETGLKSKWFKRDEGRFGDGVCCLFDYPDKNFRLYFIRFVFNGEDAAIIIGGGGFKPKEAHSFQEVPKLQEENYLLRSIAEVVNKLAITGELAIDSEGLFNNLSNEQGLKFDLIR